MAAVKRFTTDVPEGHGAHTEPVVEERRYKDVVLSRGTEADLLDIANALQEIFPAFWWDPREPLETRPEPKTRTHRCAERFRLFVSDPRIETILARDANTNEFLGCASWFQPGFDTICPLRRDSVDHFNMKEKFGWTDDYVEELWSSINTQLWDSRFILFDNDRKREMANEPHWYLAPLMVATQHHGRGVGGLLMKYAIEKADAASPPETMYLESSATARPMYMRYGFRPVKGTETALVRYPKGDPRRPDPDQENVSELR